MKRTTYKPTFWYVLLRIQDVEKEITTDSGLVIPLSGTDEQREMIQCKGTVVEIGPLAGIQWSKQGVSYKVGDVVHFRDDGARIVRDEDNNPVYRIVNDNAIHLLEDSRDE